MNLIQLQEEGHILVRQKLGRGKIKPTKRLYAELDAKSLAFTWPRNPLVVVVVDVDLCSKSLRKRDTFRVTAVTNQHLIPSKG